MSNNLFQKIQEKVGCQPLQKIDANTLQVVEDVTTPNEERFSQAVVPTVLTALYKFSRTNDGAEKILNGDIETNWTDIIFDDKKTEIISKVVSYSYHQTATVIAKINTVAKAAIALVREEVTATGSIADVKTVLANSLDEVLLYLPTSLHIGELLHDNTLDDSTHKMEGPISSIMTAIGNVFSESNNDEKEVTK